MAKTYNRDFSSNKQMVAGRVTPLGPAATVQGGTKTLTGGGKSPKIQGVKDSGIQGGTDTLRGASKGGSALMGGLKQVRNSQFAPSTGSRGNSKVKGGSSAQSTEGRD